MADAGALPSEMAHDLEEMRKASKRLARHVKGMTQEVAYLQSLYAKYGIEFQLGPINDEKGTVG